ncbi:hypothetical protein ABIA33_002254 [Streptacidiphilus sp. MAP12-16]|jgi:hypothetical protein
MAVAAKEAVVGVGLVGQEAGLFAVTNVGGLLVLSLFFAQGAGNVGGDEPRLHPSPTRVIGALSPHPRRDAPPDAVLLSRPEGDDRSTAAEGVRRA